MPAKLRPDLCPFRNGWGELCKLARVGRLGHRYRSMGRYRVHRVVWNVLSGRNGRLAQSRGENCAPRVKGR